MKRPFLLLGLALAALCAIIVVSATVNRSANAENGIVPQQNGRKNNGQRNGEAAPSTEKPPARVPEHAQALSGRKVNCKSCHDCEYPTRRKPCLTKCPKDAGSVYHSPSEAPEVLVLDELSKSYGSVVFSHRMHAQMSEMGVGCTGCHHYNTTGPVLNCKRCHEQGKLRENIAVPDLSSAYHRQCMPCHRQWGRSTECNSCHIPRTSDASTKLRLATLRLKGKNHPPTPKPDKIVYETGYEKGAFVTFYHDEHITVFKQTCVICHKGDNCIKCHDVRKTSGNGASAERHLRVKKSFQEHHRACTACHENDACSRCHGLSEKSRFNHGASTGWELKRYHARLSCQRCHRIRTSFDRPDKNCRSCHKGWKSDTFRHGVTGLALSPIHRELECENCHDTTNYSRKPACRGCHDDRDFPRVLPGKRVAK